MSTCTCPSDGWDDIDCPIHHGTDDRSLLHGYEVDWDELWTANLGTGEFFLEPIIPAGAKVTHLYAPGPPASRN